MINFITPQPWTDIESPIGKGLSFFQSENINQNFLAGKTDEMLLDEAYGPGFPEKLVPKIDITTEVASSGQLVNNKWEERIFDVGKQFIGWGAFIASIVKNDGQINITKVYSSFLQIAETLKAFDWNQSDAQLELAIKNQNTALASIWGGTFGKGVAGLVGVSVAAGAGLSMPRIGGGALARRVMDVVREEATEEFIGDFKAALNFTAQKAIASTSIKAYMKIRFALKSLPASVLGKFFDPDQVDFIKNEWGSGKGGQITFNDFMDDQIEKISSPSLQSFAEEFVDELWDGLVDYGYIIAQELDSAYEQARLERFQRDGDPSTIVLIPNTDAPEDTITYIDTPRGEIMERVQDDLRQYNRWQGHNVGMIVAGDYQESVATRPMLRKLVIEFSERPAPPWVMPNNKVPRRSFVAIPDIKVGTTWNQIKKAAKGYMWGRFRATVHLANRRQIVVYGETREIALMKAEELADLSASEKLRTHCSEEVDVPTKQKKEPRMMYPKVARLMHRTNSMDGNGNIIINGQYYDTEILSFLLWTEDEPPNTPQIT